MVVEPDVTWELACDLLCVEVAWYVEPPAVVPLVDVVDVCESNASLTTGLHHIPRRVLPGTNET